MTRRAAVGRRIRFSPCLCKVEGEGECRRCGHTTKGEKETTLTRHICNQTVKCAHTPSHTPVHIHPCHK